MEIKITGICGSPIKGGNTEIFLMEALNAAKNAGDVQTELISLAGKDIRDCRHCNWCLTKQEEGKSCVQKDDMVDIPRGAYRLQGYEGDVGTVPFGGEGKIHK